MKYLLLNSVEEKFMAIHFTNIPATYRSIPRVGSTSFKYWVRKNIPEKDRIILIDNDNPIPDMLANLSMNDIENLWPNYGTTFTFVRNPYSRLVSIFHFLGQEAKKRIYKRKGNLDFVDLKKFPIEDDILIFLEYKKGFKNWIKNSYKYSHSFSMSLFNNKDTQSQLFWLNDVVPNLFIKLEQMDQDFVKIQELIGCPAEPIHMNQSIHSDYRNYYDDEIKSIVYPWVEKDLDTFKYTF